MNKLTQVLAVLVLVGCGPVDSEATVDPAPLDVRGTSADELRLPSEDRPETVDVGSWNVEWFGAPDEGPTNEVAQQANVRQVLVQTDLDLVGLVEVVKQSLEG